MGYISKHHKFNVGDNVYLCSSDGEKVYRYYVGRIQIDVQSNGTQISYVIETGVAYREDELSDSANEAFRTWDYAHQQAADEVIAVEPEPVVVDPDPIPLFETEP